MSKKAVTVEQLLENARKSEALTMQVAEAMELEKQDKLTGAAGQVVGFDADGNPVAQSGVATETYVDDLVGDISSLLDAINGEVA